jgi:hypothetical protein
MHTASYPRAHRDDGAEAPETGKMDLDLASGCAGRCPKKWLRPRKDLAEQDGRRAFHQLLVDPSSGDIFCLSEAPSAEAVATTEAHDWSAMRSRHRGK